MQNCPSLSAFTQSRKCFLCIGAIHIVHFLFVLHDSKTLNHFVVTVDEQYSSEVLLAQIMSVGYSLPV